MKYISSRMLGYLSF